MRVAFCIYGQIRNEHLSFPHIEQIARKYDAQIFLSVWQKRGSKTSGALETSQLSRIFGPEVGYTLPRMFFDRLFQAFPTLKESLDEFSEDISRDQIRSYFPAASIDIENNGHLLDFTKILFSDVNSLRMLYKMWRSYLMMKDYEQRMGIRFDLVALFRPDVIPPETMPTLAPNALGVVQYYPHFVHDMFMLGNTESIDKIIGLYGKCAMNATRPWKGIHVELHDQVVENGLQLEVVHLTAGVTDSGETQAEGRQVLRRLLKTQSYNHSFQPIADWTALARILLQTIELADRGPAAPTFDDLQPFIEEDRNGTYTTEAAFSLCGFLAESIQRYDLAFLAETCRIAIAIRTDGLPTLVKLKEWIIPRWKHLASRAGRDPLEILTEYLDRKAPRDDITTTLVRWLDVHLDTSMRWVFNDLIQYPAISPPSIDELIRTMETLKRFEGLPAEDVATLTLALAPADWRAFDAVGHFRSRAGQHAAALTCAVKAMELEGSGSWGFNARIGQIYADLGDLKSARRFLQIAADLPGGGAAKRLLDELPA